MKLSLNQAAKTSCRAKSTLLDAIKNGRLSAIKTKNGHYEIDPSELHRVFPFSAPERPEQALDRTPEPMPTTRENISNTRELELEVQLLREMLEKAETNADHWRKMAERQQALLEDKRSKRFFKWPLGQ